MNTHTATESARLASASLAKTGTPGRRFSRSS